MCLLSRTHRRTDDRLERVVLNELRQQPEGQADTDVARLEQELTALKEREARLIQLFALGEFDETAIREQAAALKRRRAVLEDRLGGLRPQRLEVPEVDEGELARACTLHHVDDAAAVRRG